VVVVPTGVHHANVLSVVLGSFRRLEGQVNQFGDRKSVHVGTESDGWPRASAVEDPDDASVSHTCSNLQPQRGQVPRDEFGRSKFAIGKFRVLMNISPPGDDFGHHCLDAPLEITGPR
jgi:hypothetical protein